MQRRTLIQIIYITLSISFWNVALLKFFPILSVQFLSITLKRIGFGVVLLFIVLILNFFLMHLAPGDIADTIAIDAGGADEEMMDAIRKAVSYTHLTLPTIYSV